VSGDARFVVGSADKDVSIANKDVSKAVIVLVDDWQKLGSARWHA
jgi:hypothetical protein